jgi:hypothetical protein
MGKRYIDPGPPPPYADPVAQLLGRLAWLMDRAFSIPGTRVRVGLDALLGLLPIGGDVLTGVVQAGFVLIALGRYRVPPEVAARMMANVLLDTTVGAIPLLGDLFDVAFKANTRNMTLLEPYLHRREADAWAVGPQVPRVLDVGSAATSWGCIAVIAVVLLGVLALVLVGFVTVIRWLFRA